ncbi:hypothetical protein Q3G72_015661 [Acer saccharum]|nr:hypothetical protein Q3G72_015661 [Acer saccharum]
MFVFSAQQEAKMNEVMKEKPPDPNFNAKRARAHEDLDDNMVRKSGDSFKSKLLGHSKEVCKEGKEEPKKATEVPDNGEEVTAAGKDSFGPWMPVSYGKNGRNNTGGKFLSRRNGNVTNSGGIGSSPKNNVVNRTVEVEKAIGAVKNVSGKNNQPRTVKQNKTDSSKVLSDISNRGKSSNVQWNKHPKKVLEVNRSSFNKPFEESANKKGLDSVGKVHKMGKQQWKLVDNHQANMEDELKDSEVLKALHQDMLNSGTIDKVTGEGSMDGVCDNVLDNFIEQVDVPGASNFDEVASKLKEAMEVAME